MASGGEPSWAWLGLLKWSLSYSDGTRPSSETMKPLSPEDKAFLEEVMKDGIINEGERMKTILAELADTLEVLKAKAEGKQVGEEKKELSDEEMAERMRELRDIVEQIDYARAFMSLGGLTFLLGCAAEQGVVPTPFRASCLAVLATMCQNNPPVQLNMLEKGSIVALSDLYFSELEYEKNVLKEERSAHSNLRTRLVQAFSCSVRNHEIAEDLFCRNENAVRVIESGLASASPLALQKRALFFFRALVTSDTCSRERMHIFARSLAHVCETRLTEDTDPELRELSLDLLTEILRQKKGVNTILDRRNDMVTMGIGRVSAIRALKGEEREYADVELKHWEDLITELARAEPDSDEQTNPEPLLIEAPKAVDNNETVSE
uniref:Nucleotide exchange factor Fes1 domain-containing protein n=1 Tax=Attheya septentrionalis TaxID=420275 RepID=A0A7S2UD21_9STRA|mmetsp:Transcript_17672/g.31925  ORF Transcript_17672/g.31925 Transcript_17672/m.31925 type:complete len:378 (+) Transcript_17672:146-1279(+)|eukprot:CAMPEP_0198299506 /NCGR_PEP_ID=MMETSP1449-20131203/44996_1 /TAXON_ID=420275 /ORGANISM="Attheya septentrionalis, Strain CCMP2084" /LENGTH=377 /DNA_ID=CAMNT_0044001081 /DNA_START=85 /DNA_END=1218 /DNA_ORIENTATION=-